MFSIFNPFNTEKVKLDSVDGVNIRPTENIMSNHIYIYIWAMCNIHKCYYCQEGRQDFRDHTFFPSNVLLLLFQLSDCPFLFAWVSARPLSVYYINTQARPLPLKLPPHHTHSPHSMLSICVFSVTVVEIQFWRMWVMQWWRLGSCSSNSEHN